MKKRILLVDGYNMIAFWQETRQLFKTNQLDQARETLLRKLNHYATLNILILSVYLMLSLFQGAVSVMISIVSVLFLLRKMRQQIAILSAQRLR